MRIGNEMAPRPRQQRGKARALKYAVKVRNVVMSVGSGMLLGAGFAPLGWWPATIIGVALFLHILTGVSWRGAAWRGYLAGLGLNLVTLSWIGVLGSFVAVGLIAVMSLWLAAFGILVSLLRQLRAWPLLIPASWVSLELAMSHVPFGGFPWNRLAYTAVDQPLSGWFAVIGATGVSFLVALCGSLLLLAVEQRHTRRAWIAGGLLAALLLGSGTLHWLPTAPAGETLTVGYIQGGVNRAEKGTGTYARSVTNNALSETVFLLAQARTSGEPELDFVVWPENATDTDPATDPRARSIIETATQLTQAPILVGAVTDGPVADSRQTTGIWWDPAAGPGATYHKRNLVPFGEWIPFRDFLLPRFPILRQIGRQSIPGEGPGVMAAPLEGLPDLKLGNVICFELAWDETVYDTVRHGGQVLVSQSNTNTYLGTGESPQQLVMNRVRAMELGREFVAVTLNGRSGLIDAHGRVLQPTQEFTAASRIVQVGLRSNVTLPVVLGPWPGYLATAVWLLAVGWLAVRRWTPARLVVRNTPAEREGST